MGQRKEIHRKRQLRRKEIRPAQGSSCRRHCRRSFQGHRRACTQLAYQGHEHNRADICRKHRGECSVDYTHIDELIRGGDMAIPLKDIETVLSNSKYSGAYFKDHRPKNYNFGVRVWYLPNDILLRTPPIRVPPEESINIQHLNIYTKAASDYAFGRVARKIASDADVGIAITPDPELLGSGEIEETDIFSYIFFVDVETVDDLLDGVKSVEIARGLLHRQPNYKNS